MFKRIHILPHFYGRSFVPRWLQHWDHRGELHWIKSLRTSEYLFNINYLEIFENSTTIYFSRDALHIIENETRGFFTGPGLDGPQARCVYLTAIQLLRIAGAQGSLRPMLEALFHRMLLLPLPQNRTEPLKCVKEIFK